MREIKTPQTLHLKNAAHPASAYPRERPINVTFGPVGEVSDDGSAEDAVAEWLGHVEAGRIGA